MTLLSWIPSLSSSFQKTDSPSHIVAALLVGMIVGYMLLSRPTAMRPSLEATRMLLSTMSVQIGITLADILRHPSLLPSLGPLLWLPIWGLFSLGIFLGMSLNPRIKVVPHG